MIKIKSAKFVKGIVSDDAILRDGISQIAFVGRSNVGKSSVINALVNKRDLVKVSKRPGMTKQINFFLINGKFYLVDLPGYGYAKASIEDREKIRQLILWYLGKLEARPLNVVLVVDAKAGLTPLDKEMIEILKEQDHRFAIIANKIDKLNRREFLSQLDSIKTSSGIEDVFPYSAKTKQGTQALLEKLFSPAIIR